MPRSGAVAIVVGVSMAVTVVSDRRGGGTDCLVGRLGCRWRARVAVGRSACGRPGVSRAVLILYSSFEPVGSWGAGYAFGVRVRRPLRLVGGFAPSSGAPKPAGGVVK